MSLEYGKYLYVYVETNMPSIEIYVCINVFISEMCSKKKYFPYA